MREITVINNVSLDGVMQAPGAVDEDTRDGFRGGWAAAGNADPVIGAAMGEHFTASVELLLGRRTYEGLHAYWPHQGDHPFTEALNRIHKYVASTTLAEPLPWQNSTLLSGDAVDAVAALKADGGPDLVVMGSGELVRALARHGLVDEYLLLVHPLVLGAGRRLFTDDAASLRLVRSARAATGVLANTYRAAS